jgi:copper transport protein
MSGFAAGSALAAPTAWVAVILRWLLLCGLAIALGGTAGRGLARQFKGDPPAALPGPWALRGSLAGSAAAAGLLIVVATEHPSRAAILIAVVELTAFGGAAAAFRGRRAGLGVTALLAVVAAEGVRAHPEHIIPVAGALITYCHLTAAVLWAGMLLYTLRAAAAWRHFPAAMRDLVRLYANAAAWLLAWIALTGVISAAVLVPVGALVTTSYGIVLIVKGALVAAVAVLAVAGRVWLRRRPERGAGPALATKVECALLAAVLAITALLTVLTPPARPIRIGSPGGGRHAPAAATLSPQPRGLGPAQHGARHTLVGEVLTLAGNSRMRRCDDPVPAVSGRCRDAAARGSA